MIPTRPRRLLTTGFALVLVACVAASCGGGGGSKPAARNAPKGTVVVTPGPVVVASAGSTVALPDTTRDQVVSTVQRYVDLASVQPLVSGRPVGDLAPVLAATAVARATGPDRAVVVDEGLPRATADVVGKALPVALTALADANGAVVLVTAALQLSVDTKVARGPVQIRRNGELLFAPEGGSWKIAGFDLDVVRTGKGLEAPTGQQKKQKAAS